MKIAEVYEIASSYGRFAEPIAELHLCNGPACRMARADASTEIGDVETTACLGACDQAPAALIAGQRRVRFGRDSDEHLAASGYVSAEPIASNINGEAVLAALDDAGLGGMGGARFPVAQKWRLVAAGEGPRHVVINADESEPGSFKDRQLLETNARQVLTGALVAARVVGAELIHVYLRSHHHDLMPELAAAAEALRPAWPDIAFEWRRSGGSYICGEETTLIECLEGRAGRPQHKPPFPAQAGLFGRPTLIHNVETYFWVNEILSRGADWFRSHGTRAVRGLRHYSLSGRVRRPGVCVAPYGITLAELIESHGGGMADGHELAAFCPGGASGGILPATLATLPLDDAALGPQGVSVGAGAVIVLSQADDPITFVRDLMRFFADESCGQCAPCRFGTRAAVEALGQGVIDDHAALAEVLTQGSICGLGQGAGRLLASFDRHFAKATS
ncbi:NADH-ubiquinone oxidoreductase-F iron-sulfur binding region domain-containing protein [Rhodopseudomonas sp. B29]|uniref:NADH-ubiquinone oxidoreductase-F iron-sulfur binding region domain-containing protein n=1 Tax=Rhodopseudomonas sp. B29 TaxID=95607 RepID=UPI001FCC644A|nr:NADH-ubiquinone oxidoreductase-F iron-sulfur binding region domain-containing protein [Rhodopseudomonas sp. B29]